MRVFIDTRIVDAHVCFLVLYYIGVSDHLHSLQRLCKLVCYFLTHNKLTTHENLG